MEFAFLEVKDKTFITNSIYDLKQFQNIVIIASDDKQIHKAVGIKGKINVAGMYGLFSTLTKQTSLLDNCNVFTYSMPVFLEKLNFMLMNEETPKVMDSSDLPDHIREEMDQIAMELERMVSNVHMGTETKEVLGKRILELVEEGKYMVPACDDPNCEVCGYIKSILPEKVMKLIGEAKAQGFEPIRTKGTALKRKKPDTDWDENKFNKAKIMFDSGSNLTN